MLKSWKLLGIAGVLAGTLIACSTTKTPTPSNTGEPSVSWSQEVAAKLSKPGGRPASNTPPPLLLAKPITSNPPVRLETNTIATPIKPGSKPQLQPTWLNWESWSLTNGWGKPERVRNVPSWTYELKSSQGVLAITAGKRLALWNGLNLDLGFAPRLTNGQPYLHYLDLTKTFEPLTARPSWLDRTRKILVIDPGHGGGNLGAKSSVAERYEKEYALDWAFRLQRLLQNQGWEVLLTRTNDTDVSLAERVSFADRVKGDLFISLHFNSIGQPQSRSDHGGLETYCLTPVGMPSTLTRQFDDDPQFAYPNNAFDSDNYYLATRVHRALVESTGRKDRGVRRARFMTVLQGQTRPALLVEGGYLTHPSEAQIIATAEYRQKLAEAVAKALAN